MDTNSTESITKDVMREHADKVLYVSEIDIADGLPSPLIIAGTYLEDPGHPGGQYVTVIYNVGRREWQVATEYERKKATDFYSNTLADCLREFESRTQFTFPAIKVTEYGIGIYDAKEGNSAAQNPWKLEAGTEYEATHAHHGVRRFVAVNTPRGIEIAFVVKGVRNKESFGTRFLTVAEWKSLRVVGPSKA